jgi:hypothetical protein
MAASARRPLKERNTHYAASTGPGSIAVIGARRSLTAEVTATAPHSQLTGLTTTTYSNEVEASDLGLARN